MCQTVIADKFRCYRRIDLIIDRRIRPHIIGHFMGFLRQSSLLFHTCPETVFINIITFFFQNLLCQIQRESIGIIQLERVCTGQRFRSCRFHRRFHIRQNSQALINGFIKLVFFLCQNPENKVSLLFQFRISVPGAFDNRLGQLRQKLSFNPQKTSVTGRTANQTAEHIAPSHICRHDAVRDHKGR